MKRYFFALGLVVAATLLRVATERFLFEAAPHATFYLANVTAALWLGIGPAIVTGVVGALAADYFFIPPIYSIGPQTTADVIWLGFYLAVSVSIIWAVEAQKRAKTRADRNAELASARLSELETEIRKREEAERETEAQRRWAAQTLASIADGVITTDVGGSITFLNGVAESLTGWKLAEAKGHAVEEVLNLLNERTHAPIDSPVYRVLRQGAAATLANHTVLVTRSGQEIPIDDSGAPIRDQNKNVIGAVLVFRDVTERRRSEEQTARLASIVESSSDAIISKDLDGVIQSWNSAAERVYGYSEGEVTGRCMRDLIPPDRLGEETDILERLKAGEPIEHFETIRIRKSGEPVHVSLTISPIRDKEGEIIGASHTARDITVQKKFEEQLRQTQKLESLGVLAGGVAHDFNNLLTGIIGASSLTLDMLAENDPARSLVEQVLKAGERAADLTGQLLAYSGRGKFFVEAVNVTELAGELLTLLRTAVPRTVELRTNLAGRLPPVEADASQLHQLLMNLVINGAEAIGDAPGVVTISTSVRQISGKQERPEFANLKPGEYVAIEVADTGCGMDSATIEKMFDPFFTTKFMGRGLGLSGVLGIVRAHSGAIAVESQPGKGTVITVLFPAAHEAVAARPPVPERSDVTGNGRILVIDDEELVRATAKNALEKRGYEVVVAENGIEGVERFRREADRISLVLLDLTMPMMSGRDALREIRRIRPDVPVLLSSGYDEAEAARRFGTEDLAGFVQKPYTANDLARKVKSVTAGI